MRKKLIALMLCFAMIVSIGATTIFALEGDSSPFSEENLQESDVPESEDGIKNVTALFNSYIENNEEDDGVGDVADLLPETAGESDDLGDSPSGSVIEPTESEENPVNQDTDPSNTGSTTVDPTEGAEPTEPKGGSSDEEDPIPSIAEIDVELLYAQFMNLKSETELEAFIESLSEDEQIALAERLSEEDIIKVAEQCGLTAQENIITPAKNYTKVGELMPPVMVASRRSTQSVGLNGDDTPSNGLELSKTAVADVEGGYKITLEAYTTGTVTSSEESVPADIVLVLDESGSMTQTMYGYEKVYSLSQNNSYYVKSGDSYVEVKWCTEGGLIGAHDPGWYTGTHISIIWGLISFHWGTRYEPMISASDTTSGRVQFYTRSATGTTKRAALQTAATQFVNSVHADAINNNVDHRVAVVGFSDNNAALIKVALNNDMRQVAVKNGVLDAINGLNASGATYIEDGMTKAEEAFDTALAPSSTGPRNRVVIVFTDGIPGTGTWSNTTINNSANPAIATSGTLKGTNYGATVYTIGLLDGADPELDITNPDLVNSEEVIVRTNKFLHYLSSNFPNATSMTNAGTDGGIGGGYYLSASDAESLKAIFEKISQEIATPSIKLSESTVIDVISPYFTVPENTSEISIFTSAYNGSSFGSREPAPGVIPSIIDNKLTISGFNFDENFVSDTGRGSPPFYGKKLIIEFTVQPKPGFLGGNGVPTNDPSSGVYDKEGKPAGKFDVPTVDVPLKDISITIPDAVFGSYFRQPVDESKLKLNAEVEIGDIELNLDPEAVNFGLETWKNEFVNIDVSTSTTSSGSLGEVTSDFNYSLTVTVTPKTPGSVPASGATGKGNGEVLVFKPEVTFKDSDVWYGGRAVFGTDYGTSTNFVSETWIHDTTDHKDTTVTMLNAKPKITYVYTPEIGKITTGDIVNTKQDIPVKVTASILVGTAQVSTDITTNTTFVHNACSPACAWENPTTAGNPAFLLHVKTVQLNVTKENGDLDEAFLIQIKRNGKPYTELSIQGGHTLTINELPVGEYEVIEDLNWSWRYTVGLFPINGKVVLASINTEGTVTLTNTKKTDYWLNDYVWETNIKGVPKESKVDD